MVVMIQNTSIPAEIHPLGLFMMHFTVIGEEMLEQYYKVLSQIRSCIIWKKQRIKIDRGYWLKQQHF
jgi:hypothetical protein